MTVDEFCNRHVSPALLVCVPSSRRGRHLRELWMPTPAHACPRLAYLRFPSVKVNPFGVECEHHQIRALTAALRAGVVIAYLDRVCARRGQSHTHRFASALAGPLVACTCFFCYPALTDTATHVASSRTGTRPPSTRL